ncbi:membrane-anchored glycerophosphoryl diester phosphodiesterase (GDPDase) [Agromyces hippuratus]|uniref:Membrane-anchored glycerophosphoryl diester phosphodiesterase (GDPDase) n=1 Tax=Agromyces hippuratus TaxID=286438 RepID=A0A852WRB3_9MICO|nr:glycerophosphoryl diester phosphodiesterase membrane domain-containing protein [Agromyces hippuratus]NYG20486.1 membrane-anchored glycerophosphoryl diester phosphodiesterase (GDPDase) [Agromyces hippuratus]
MSDRDWQAPGGAPVPPQVPDAPAAAGFDPAAFPPPTAAAPPTAAVPPTFPVPPSYGPPPTAGAPLGWTPPPKPGLLPLHPLGFGTLLWAPFAVLRRNPAATFGTGLVVQLISVIATVAVIAPFMVFVVTRVESASSDADADALMSGAVGGFLLLMLVPMLLSLVASAFLQGVMVVDVASGTLGDRLRFGALWKAAAKRIWPLLGWTAMVAGAIAVVFGALVLAIVLAALIGPAALVVAVLIGLLAGFGLLVLGAWLGTKLSIVPSIIVLEGVGIRTAMRRSWQLTTGYFWRTLGTLLLVGVILSIASQIVVQPVSLIGTILAAIIDPTGAGAAIAITVVTMVVTLVLSLLIGAITAVVQAALVAVIYIDLRMRTEALDLELVRHIEQRGAGMPVTDPYRAPAAAAARPDASSAPAWP